MRVPSLVFLVVCSPFLACTHVAGQETILRQGICNPSDLPNEVRDARTAVHESGHIVAAWLLGCAIVERVTIIEDRENEGHTFFYANFCTPRQDAIVSLAGVAALDLVYGRNPANASGSSEDTKKALDDALRQARRDGVDQDAEKAEVERLMESWRLETLDLLKSRQCALVAIAVKLRNEKNIVGVHLIPYLVALGR